MALDPETFFCIDWEGEAIGSIGLTIRSDVHRLSAELGYFLGEPYWGRGIVTEAIGAVARLAIEELGLVRVFARPYAHNDASCRVLEKAGFVREGRMRKSAIKDGQILDQFM